MRTGNFLCDSEPKPDLAKISFDTKKPKCLCTDHFMFSKHRSHSMTEVNQYPACRSPRNSGPANGSPARAAAHRTQATPTLGKENPTEGKATRIPQRQSIKGRCRQKRESKVGWSPTHKTGAQ